MRPAALARRSVALVAATALISGGLAGGLAAPAHAAGTISDFNPKSWDNRSTVTITVTGTGFPTSPLPIPLEPSAALVFTPVVDDPQNEVAQFVVPAEPGNSSTQVVAEVPLAMAPTGDYTLRVANADGSDPSAPAAARFNVYGFGSASATGVAFGPNPSGNVVECTLLISCVDRAAAGGRPLDINGSNIAIGAKVNFLLPGTTTTDTGLSFFQHNPNNEENNIGTQDADEREGTGYASSTLLQGNYTHKPDASAGVTPGFTPGMHKLQIVNNDGQTSGTTVDFAQPWFPASNAFSSGIGVGAQNRVITLTGQGFRFGSALRISSGASGTPGLPGYCAGVTVGPSTVSAPDGKGTYSKISAPVSMADCGTDDLSARDVAVEGPDGGRFFRAGLLPIIVNPTFGSVQSGYDVLGQGARVGFRSEVVQINGSGFQGQGQTDPTKMVRFEFGEGVTVTTREVLNPSTALVSIEVANDAPVGDRTATAINPDGGTGTKSGDYLPDGETPDPTGDPAPLTIEPGPQVTKVSPAGFPTSTESGAVTVTVTGSFTPDHSYVVRFCEKKDVPDCTETVQGVNVGAPTDTATTLTFPVSTNNAAPGLYDLLVSDSDNRGRFYCAGCVGIDSLTISSPSPAKAPNTGSVTLTAALQPVQGTTALDPTGKSRATLTRVVPLPGNPAISASSLTQPGGSTVSASFNLRGAAPGQYSLTVVKDPATTGSPTWQCTGCLTVTGAAITVTSFDRKPTDGTAGKSTSGGRGANGLTLEIKGTNFSKGMQVSIPEVVVQDVALTLPSSGLGTLLTVKVDVPADAEPGTYPVTVISGDGSSPATETGSRDATSTFQVTPAPAPSGGPTPAAYGQGAGTTAYSAANPGDTTGAKITVTGADFADDATLHLGSGITVLTRKVTQGDPPTCTPPPLPEICSGGSDDTLEVTVAIADTAATGPRDVVVVNGDGGRSTMSQAFTVNQGPKVTSVANNEGFPVLTPAGSTEARTPITILGSGFSNSTLALLKLDSQQKLVKDTAVTFDNVTVVDPGKITATAVVAPNTPRGGRALGVTNPGDKGFGAIGGLFIASKPTVVRSVKLAPGSRTLRATWVNPITHGGAPITTYHLVLRDLSTFPVATRIADVSGSTRAYTFSSLVNGHRYEFAINAVNAAGPGPVTKLQGIPGIETQLLLGKSRSIATWGVGVNIGGKLLRRSPSGSLVPFSGKIIELEFRPAKGSGFRRTARTSSTGAWSYNNVKISHNWVVIARYLGDATYRPASRGTSVRVATRVLKSFPANGSRSSAATTLRITGSVAPSAPNAKIYLQRLANGRWSNFAQTTVDISTFAFTLKPGRGTYTLRILLPSQHDQFKRQINYQGVSSGFTLYRT